MAIYDRVVGSLINLFIANFLENLTVKIFLKHLLRFDKITAKSLGDTVYSFRFILHLLFSALATLLSIVAGLLSPSLTVDCNR